MVKNLFNENLDDIIYKEDYESSLIEYSDDPLYERFYPILSNEYLDYITENYKGKYVGEQKYFSKQIKFINLPSRKKIRENKVENIELNKVENIELNKVENTELKFNYTIRKVNVDNKKVNNKKVDNKKVTNIYNFLNDDGESSESDNDSIDYSLKINKTINLYPYNRNEAFDILSNKEKIKENLKNTKLCLSVNNNTICRHKNCRFAHSKEELIIRNCLFKDKCYLIKKDINNIYTNVSKTKICDCRHSDESLTNYHKRVENLFCTNNVNIKLKLKVL